MQRYFVAFFIAQVSAVCQLSSTGVIVEPHFATFIVLSMRNVFLLRGCFLFGSSDCA